MPKSKAGEREEDEMEMDRGDEEEESVDVVEMLKSDHRKVQELFTRFEDSDKRSRASIASEALTELEIHTAIEEELVYPAIREAIDQEELIDEAREEHHVATLLIKELHKMDVGDEAYATKFKVLGELVGHHIEEEEGEILPQAQESEWDTEELGRQVMKRKEQLMQKHRHGGAKKSSSHKRRRAA
ncbi:MAG TPA: hemerythrin domain-containing protein [Nitrospira sp.]|nr:hemerythrin domain-containing protein [Nitrospira sp.]